MSAELQSWLALGVVAIAVIALAWRTWSRRNHHEGCECPGTRNNRALAQLKKRAARRR